MPWKRKKDRKIFENFSLGPVTANDLAVFGRVYLPTGSYAEMGEWSLPFEARREFVQLSHDAADRGAPEARWMRGGFWRQFQVNYREINDLHKQMLRVSRKVEGLDGTVGEEQLAVIADHLYQGQSNDCYWHGLFGGIYLSHMRLATLEHLIAAEDAADRGRVPALSKEELDHLLDIFGSHHRFIGVEPGRDPQ